MGVDFVLEELVFFPGHGRSLTCGHLGARFRGAGSGSATIPALHPASGPDPGASGPQKGSRRLLLGYALADDAQG